MAKQELAIGMEVVQRQTKLQMKLVEVASSAEGLEVTNFAVVELPPGGTRLVGPRLSNVFKEMGFRAKIINTIIPYPSIDYRQVSLPPMSKGDLKTAIDREAKKELKFPVTELVTDYEIIGESEEKGLRRMELLVARAQSKDTEELFSMAEEFRLRFNSLTVIPAALFNLLKIRGGTGDETLAVIHAGTNKGTIIISHQGNIRFPREFPLRAGAESAEGYGHLVAETKRSLLFVKQQARGLTVKKILILGDIGQPDTLVDTMTSETGIPAEVYAPIGLDLSPLGDRVHEFRGSLPALSIPLGLAWYGPEHATLNLMAQQLAEIKKSNLAKMAVILSGAALVIILAVYYVLLLQKAKPYKGEYAQRQQELAVLRPQTSEMKEMQQERDTHGSRHAFLGKIHGPVTSWENILRTLSLSVPDDVLLQSLDIKEAAVGWLLEIRGSVTARDAATVQKGFNEFFSLLLTNPSLREAKVESLTIGPVTVAGAVGLQASKLEFAVSVRVEPKEVPGGATKG